jgi:CRP/FNR family cyclic AMP-dependent transcriptional regulator
VRFGRGLLLTSHSPTCFNQSGCVQSAKRLREANKKIESLALLDVYGRVSRLLKDMTQEKEGQRVIEERLTHQEIANMIGSSREMVSIILKELASGGYITVGKNTITINKKLPYSW